MQDYSNFSWEAIEADLKKMKQVAINRAVADGIPCELAEAMVNVVFEKIIRNFPEINGFLEPREQK